MASGGWDELLARTPLPRVAGVGKFGLLWGEQASICKAWMAFLTYIEKVGNIGSYSFRSRRDLLSYSV